MARRLDGDPGERQAAENPVGQPVISSDGQQIGSVIGLHRDAASGTVRWAVLDIEDSSGGSWVVPFSQAVPTPTGLRIPVESAHVLSAPRLSDPTRIGRGEEELLLAHYAREPSGAATTTQTVASLVRSEEQLRVQRLEWRPYKRVRVRTVVRSRQVTHVVEERWQELVLEDQPVTVVDRLGLSAPEDGDLDLVLHREEVVVTKRIVPYERVRISKGQADSAFPVEDSVRKERVEVERYPTSTP
ncbi:MAG: hypothetical protein NVSMB29_11700 [Candidatus Dormibacteria bacterium]